MKARELREFGQKLGVRMSVQQSARIMRGASLDTRLILEMCDRWLTGEVLIRPELTERRERVDATPIIDVIRMNRKWKNDEAIRVPFVARDRRHDGWSVVDGRTIIWRRNRRYETGRELREHDPVYLWDERKVLWESGTLK